MWNFPIVCKDGLMRNILNWRNMEKEFNIGDRVRLKSNGSIVEVVIAKDGWIAYDENRRIAGSCPMTEVEPVDPKTAFLSDLAAVLRKHNAVINVGWNDYFDTDKSPRIDMDIMFADSNKGICLEDVLGKSLTADNIMDYDKE